MVENLLSMAKVLSSITSVGERKKEKKRRERVGEREEEREKNL